MSSVTGAGQQQPDFTALSNKDPAAASQTASMIKGALGGGAGLENLSLGDLFNKLPTSLKALIGAEVTARLEGKTDTKAFEAAVSSSISKAQSAPPNSYIAGQAATLPPSTGSGNIPSMTGNAWLKPSNMGILAGIMQEVARVLKNMNITNGQSVVQSMLSQLDAAKGEAGAIKAGAEADAKKTELDAQKQMFEGISQITTGAMQAYGAHASLKGAEKKYENGHKAAMDIDNPPLAQGNYGPGMEKKPGAATKEFEANRGSFLHGEQMKLKGLWDAGAQMVGGGFKTYEANLTQDQVKYINDKGNADAIRAMLQAGSQAAGQVGDASRTALQATHDAVSALMDGLTKLSEGNKQTFGHWR